MNLARIFSISRFSTRLLNASFTEKVGSRLFHFLRPTVPLLNSSLAQNTNFLQPQTPQVMPVCGFKVKGRLRRRCKDCYFVVRDERTYIICATHPRHKQMSFVSREKNRRIMTPHGMQCKNRPW